MKKQIAVVVAAAALALSASAHAEGWHPVLGASLTGGGKTLVTVQYTNGQTQDIRSGGLVHLFGGVEYDFNDQFSLQGNIGYHVDNSTARNGDVRFSRWPVELIGLWKVNPTIRLGVGVRKATNAEINSSGAASSVGSGSFGSNTGLILQGEYLFSPHWGMLVRGVTESYDVYGTKVQGNHIGVGGFYRF